ncbi:MAG: MarR family transcriptional regulator [Steroidobacteraceae bacterium]
MGMNGKEKNRKALAQPRLKHAPVELGPLRHYIGFQLRRAQDLSFQAFARRTGQIDLGPGRFAILALINENPGLNQTLLSRASGRDKSTLTPALRDLEKRGFISRHRSTTDGRAFVLHLTSKGKTHLADLTEHAEAHDRDLDAIVGSFHKPLLIHLLEQIVDGLSNELNRPSE